MVAYIYAHVCYEHFGEFFVQFSTNIYDAGENGGNIAVSYRYG